MTAANKPAKKRPGIEEQRQNILEAAVELFAGYGEANVPVSQICRQAGVSRDTYYRCFTDKEELLALLYQTAVNDHIETVLGAWDMDYSNPEWLHRVCSDTIDAILQQHNVARFLFVASADPASDAYHIIHQAYDKAAGRMQRWCKSKYGTQPSREYLVALMVATQWLVHNAIISGMDEKSIEGAKQASEHLFYAAFSTLKPADA